MKLAYSTSFVRSDSLHAAASRKTEITPTCQRTEPQFSGSIRQQVYQESWEWLQKNARKTSDYLYQQISDIWTGIRPLMSDTPKMPDIEAPPVIPSLFRENPMPSPHAEVQLSSIRIDKP